MTALLELRGLDVRFGAQHAVRGIDLAIGAGETVALVGESGCGKSTTALALMGLLPTAARIEGRVLFEGRDLAALPARGLRDLRGNAIAMIFQEPMTSLNPVLTIGDQVGEVLRRHQGLSAAAARRRAIELLDLVRLPDPQRRVDDHPHRLSGGQRQRAMIAMAVACRPRLLVADEPTTALDVTIQAQVLELLDALRREFAMSLLLITHDLGVVGQWADRVAVMHDGRIVEQDTTEAVFTRPRHAYTRGLLAASLSLDGDRHYRAGRLAEIGNALNPASGRRDFSVVRGGAPERRPDPAPPAAAAAPLLRVEDLRVAYPAARGRTAAVDGVSFDVRHGETVGLVGESGCGKSTLGKAILRLLEPSAGRIVYDGTDLVALHGRRLQPYRRRIQMVFQDPYASLNPRHSVGDILDAALRVHGVADRAERLRRARRIVDQVGLPAATLARWPHEFSGGQRQRIGIARALVLEPQLLVCDEPVSALDVSVQAQVLNLLVDLKRELGLSYLFVSHDLSVVRYIADRVLVMHDGRIVERGDQADIWRHPAHPYTRSLIAAVPRHPYRSAAPDEAQAACAVAAS